MSTTKRTQMKQEKYRIRMSAFTLVENLIVLSLVSLSYLVFAGHLARVTKVVKGEIQLYRFEQRYQELQFQSLTQGKGKVLKQSDMVIDETLELKQGADIAFDDKGNNSSLTKLVFYLPYSHKTVSYQLMMGSGRYKKTIS